MGSWASSRPSLACRATAHSRLSYSLDTVGPLCRSVAVALAADGVLAGVEHPACAARSIRGLRLGVPRGLLFTETQAEVSDAFGRTLELLGAAGTRIDDEALDDLLGEPFRLQEQGTLIAAEAASIHRQSAKDRPEAYDPIVLGRIRRGEAISAASYVGMVQARAKLLPRLDARLADLDALLLPTVPILAARIDELEEVDTFMRVNALLLRNPSVFNFFDLPALSLPAPRAGGLPVGLMLVGQRGRDRELLAVGEAVEKFLAAAAAAPAAAA